MQSESYSGFIDRLGTFATGLAISFVGFSGVIEQIEKVNKVPEAGIGLGLLGLALVGASFLPPRKQNK